MRAQRLLLPSTERHRERASRVLVADTGVGQHAPDERTTVRRRRNLPLRLAGVGVKVVRFAARLSGRRDKKSFLSKNGRGQDHLLLASSTAGYQLLSCATSWHRRRVRRDAGRVQTAGCSAKADAASQVPSMQKVEKQTMTGAPSFLLSSSMREAACLVSLCVCVAHACRHHLSRVHTHTALVSPVRA